MKRLPDMTVRTVTLRVLGRFCVVIDGDPRRQLRIASKKGAALLAVLALRPQHTASREELATLLWGDRSSHQARLSLRQCILSVRNALAPASIDLLVLEGDYVGLRMENLRIDALEFDALSKSNELDDLQHAAALFGELLCNLSIEAEGFVSWLRVNRSRLAGTAERVFEVLADRLDATGCGERAIDAGERLVALDPLREDQHRRLLRLYARHRGAGAALAKAKELATLLKIELAVKPEPATAALVSEIQRGAIARVEPGARDLRHRRALPRHSAEASTASWAQYRRRLDQP
jgi:DNA-binding SARP family transcriptional activator